MLTFGMGADLFESYYVSIIAAVALAVSAGYDAGGVAVPMLIAAIGIIASFIGTFFVRCGDNVAQESLLKALRRGTRIASGIVIVAAFPVIYYCLDCANNPERIGVYFAVIAGLFAGVAIGAITEYYTSDHYKPVKNLARASQTGPATIVIGGISLGMLSTLVTVLIVCASILVSFFAAGGPANFSQGLYGVSLSAVGMLSTLGIILATDAYGIAEMAYMPFEVRSRTDALDSLGNTTAATGKGFAIGSAALTSLALIVEYIDEIKFHIPIYKPDFQLDLALTNPTVLIGLFIGAMLPYLFSSMTMKAVGNAAQSIVTEVRRQFREIAGIMDGTERADYEACVDICTRNAQKEMVLPTLLGIISPVIVGMILGVSGVAGMLAGTTISGFVLAIMMANAGGAWDNAKKYIEAGNHGGKKSDSHKAAVVGDTVGDPFKDTSGPSLNNLIKLLSVVSFVFASVILRFSIL